MHSALMRRLRHVLNGLGRLAVLLAILAVAAGGAGPALAQDGGDSTPEPATGPVVLVTTDNLRLRAAPSTASTIYFTAPKGTTVTATAVSPNFRWLRVAYNGQGGWMAREYLELQSGSPARLPVSGEYVPPAAVSAQNFLPLDEVIVEALQDVHMRTDPFVVEDDPRTTFEETNVIRIIPAGEDVSARTITPDGLWVFVQWGSYRGWVRGQYLNAIGGSVPPSFVASVQPDEAGIGFTADSFSVLPGECTTLRWSVLGDGSVYYKARNVPSQGARRECPTQNTRYSLTVVRPGYEIEQRFVTITIAEVQASFLATTEGVQYGQCTTLSWTTQYAREVYYNGELFPTDLNGSREECPTETTTYTLRVITQTGEVLNYSITVVVFSAPLPGTVVTVSFFPEVAFLSPGQCTNLVWNTQGATQVFYQGQQVAPSGSRLECPAVTTTYVLRVYTIDNRSLEYQAMVTVN